MRLFFSTSEAVTKKAIPDKLADQISRRPSSMRSWPRSAGPRGMRGHRHDRPVIVVGRSRPTATSTSLASSGRPCARSVHARKYGFDAETLWRRDQHRRAVAPHCAGVDVGGAGDSRDNVRLRVR